MGLLKILGFTAAELFPLRAILPAGSWEIGDITELRRRRPADEIWLVNGLHQQAFLDRLTRLPSPYRLEDIADPVELLDKLAVGRVIIWYPDELIDLVEREAASASLPPLHKLIIQITSWMFIDGPLTPYAQFLRNVTLCPMAFTFGFVASNVELEDFAACYSEMDLIPLLYKLAKQLPPFLRDHLFECGPCREMLLEMLWTCYRASAEEEPMSLCGQFGLNDVLRERWLRGPSDRSIEDHIQRCELCQELVPIQARQLVAEGMLLQAAADRKVKCIIKR